MVHATTYCSSIGSCGDKLEWKNEMRMIVITLASMLNSCQDNLSLSLQLFTVSLFLHPLSISFYFNIVHIFPDAGFCDKT